MTQQPPNIIVLGGINMDLVTFAPRFPRPGETVVGSRFLTYAGGKGANQAVAAAPGKPSFTAAAWSGPQVLLAPRI